MRKLILQNFFVPVRDIVQTLLLNRKARVMEGMLVILLLIPISAF